jgi:membrane-bound lytic murein transglycosylase A
MKGLRPLAALAVTAALAACATAPAPRPPYSRPQAPIAPYQPPAPSEGQPLAWSALPGWGQEDHLAAMAALQAACAVTRDPSMMQVCARARTAAPASEREARAFLEANFRLEPVPGEGLLTAYFTPEYEARETPETPFTAPVRPRPVILPTASAVITAAPSPPDRTAATPAPGQTDNLDDLLADLLGPSPSPPPAPSLGPPDRAAIDATPAPDALAWMRPEDLFFMQIQGSGILLLPDGRRMKASVTASNGLPFVPIARVMRQQGLLGADHTSGDAIHAWLSDHRGPDADAVMDQNPRYIYFRLRPDDGLEPAGAAGVPLPPGRSLAMDTGRHAFGELYWIDAEAPILAGAFPSYRRLAAHLDIGAAIKGEVRADLFTGIGEAAGREAGRVRHSLHLYRLAPVVEPVQTLVSTP